MPGRVKVRYYKAPTILLYLVESSGPSKSPFTTLSFSVFDRGVPHAYSFNNIFSTFSPGHDQTICRPLHLNAEKIMKVAKILECKLNL
jgi:hypothetical protein